MTLRPQNFEYSYDFKTYFQIKTLFSVLLIVKVPENVYVVEGEKLEINCIVKGSQPKITWSFSEFLYDYQSFSIEEHCFDYRKRERKRNYTTS